MRDEEIDIDDIKSKYRKSYNPDRPLTHMPFGKFKHEAIEAVPTYYLAWVLHQPDTRPNLLVPVARVLKERYARERAYNSHQLADNSIGE